MSAGVPSPDQEIPARVVMLAAGRPMRAVWQNELGGVTYEIGDGSTRSFVKWAPAARGLRLTDEAARLRWAGAYASVPQVLDHGADMDGEWLVTAALPGTSAVSARWLADPMVAVTAIGRGLRALHDALAVGMCPFTWTAEERVAKARRLYESGRMRPAEWHPEHRHMDPDDALKLIEDIPPIDKLVVCHGDACSPNTIVADNGAFTGHVDLGALGVADRWADIAIATWSVEWNYGPGWDGVLLDAYGVEQDPRRTAYYRLLWDLCP